MTQEPMPAKRPWTKPTLRELPTVETALQKPGMGDDGLGLS